MFALLIHTFELLLKHILSCFIYSLPSQLIFAIIFYLLLSGTEVATVTVAVFGFLFLIVNTLFFYAAVQQMLAAPGHNRIDFVKVLRWRQHIHTDFFLFITIGMMILSLLSLYFIDAVNYMFNLPDVFNQQRQENQSETAVYSMAYSGYTTLIFGSRIVAFVLLVIIINIWAYICRVGIRIPAYVEGYYLRSQEAAQLQRGSVLDAMATSFICIIAVTWLADFLISDAPQAGRWFELLVWTLSYFFIIVIHLAMWVYMYQKNVKKAGYHMTRRAD